MVSSLLGVSGPLRPVTPLFDDTMRRRGIITLGRFAVVEARNPSFDDTMCRRVSSLWGVLPPPRPVTPHFAFFYKFLRIKQGGILRDLFNLMIKMVSIYVTLLLIRDENSIVVLHMTLEKLILCM